jgi:hypothetical protein
VVLPWPAVHVEPDRCCSASCPAVASRPAAALHHHHRRAVRAGSQWGSAKRWRGRRR